MQPGFIFGCNSVFVGESLSGEIESTAVDVNSPHQRKPKELKQKAVHSSDIS